MRIISQSGTVDMPYEQMIVQTQSGNAKRIIAYESVENEEYIELAIYSTPEKALKAMEMLRYKYNDSMIILTAMNGINKVFAWSENTKSNKKKVEVIQEMTEDISFFQFPQDDEVE